ncbi:MAG: hypothetical protein AB1486_02415 [Planctomycetota bacterium]
MFRIGFRLSFAPAMGLLLLGAAIQGCSSLDCEAAGGKVSKSYQIGVSYSGIGVSYAVSEEEATKFNGRLGVLSLRYRENCEAYRDGLISKDEYMRRNRELDTILADVGDFSRDWNDWVGSLKSTAISDMDKAFEKVGTEAAREEEKEAPPELREKFDKVMARLEELEKAEK